MMLWAGIDLRLAAGEKKSRDLAIVALEPCAGFPTCATGQPTPLGTR